MPTQNEEVNEATKIPIYFQLNHLDATMQIGVRELTCIFPRSFLQSVLNSRGDVLGIQFKKIPRNEWDNPTQWLEENMYTDQRSGLEKVCVWAAAEQSILASTEPKERWLSKITDIPAALTIERQSTSSWSLDFEYELPAEIIQFSKEFLGKAKRIPLQKLLFKSPSVGQDFFRVVLSENYCWMSFFAGKKLMWSEVEPYSSAEDILYRLSAVCRYFNADLVDISADIFSTNFEQKSIQSELQKHFNPTESSSFKSDYYGDWAGVVPFLKAMNACV